MGKCKNITRLLSDALERPLTTGEWVAIRLLRVAARTVSGIATPGTGGGED